MKSRVLDVDIGITGAVRCLQVLSMKFQVLSQVQEKQQKKKNSENRFSSDTGQW